VLDLSRVAARFVLFQDLDHLTADPVLARRVRTDARIEVLLGTAVIEVLGDERVRGVRVREAREARKRELPLDGIFVEIGLLPNTDPVRGLAPLNARGEIEVDCACRTAVPGSSPPGT